MTRTRELDRIQKAGDRLSASDDDAWREWKSVSLGLPSREERTSKRKRKRRRRKKLPKSSLARAPPLETWTSFCERLACLFFLRLARAAGFNSGYVYMLRRWWLFGEFHTFLRDTLFGNWTTFCDHLGIWHPCSVPASPEVYRILDFCAWFDSGYISCARSTFL